MPRTAPFECLYFEARARVNEGGPRDASECAVLSWSNCAAGIYPLWCPPIFRDLLGH